MLLITVIVSKVVVKLRYEVGLRDLKYDHAEKGINKYNPKSEKVGTVWKTQIKKESSDF